MELDEALSLAADIVDDEDGDPSLLMDNGCDVIDRLREEVERLTTERDERTRRVRVALERLGVADCDDVLDALDEVVGDTLGLLRATEEMSGAR